MKKPMMILSFDGLDSKDIDFLKTLPTFSRFFSQAYGCSNVKTIYPSVTYPAHASIITGTYPQKHGVIDNTFLQRKRMESPDWYWDHTYIKTKTLYDIAIDEGYKVLALLWPTTAKARIQLNMPEIFSNRWFTNQILVSLLNGSIRYQIRMNKKFGNLRKGKQQPHLDDFVTACLLDTLVEEKPDMILCHFTDLDSMRHEHGFYSSEAYDALRRHEKRLERIMSLIETTEKYDDITICILGDHGSLDVTYGVNLNIWLKNEGMDLNKIISKSCDGCAYIFFENIEMIDDVMLQIRKSEILSGVVEAVYKVDDRLLVEAREDYHFVEEEQVDVIQKMPHPTAVHGYHPDKSNYRTVCYFKGNSFKSGGVIDAMSLVDIAPTLAHAIGLKMNDVDGVIK